MNATKPADVTCIGTIITARIIVYAAFLSLKVYTCKPYAVIVEKNTVNTVQNAVMNRLFL